MDRETLTELANKHQSDKGTTFGLAHGYTIVYEELLSPLRDAEIALLEIGLRHDPYFGDNDHSASPSLSMWMDYFPKARLFAIDTNDFTGLSGGRVKVFQGDQGDPEFLQSVAAVLPALDIVIDDGCHASFHQQVTFEQLFPRLKPSGFYFIEDLHWQPAWEDALPRVPLTCDFFRSPAIRALLDVSFYLDDHLCCARWRNTS
jgi:hypothetical protein